MGEFLTFLDHYWWISLVVLVGWLAHYGYCEIQRRRNPVQAQFVATLGCLVVLYYGFGILCFVLSTLVCLVHLFRR